MRCNVTNPTIRTVVVNGEVKQKSEAVVLKLNGRVDIRLNVGETGEYDLTGDQIGYLEAHGIKVKCPEREAPPPVGSKAWRTAVAADGKDPDEVLAEIEAAKKPKAAPKTAEKAKAPGA